MAKDIRALAPTGFIELAKIHTSKTHHLGDKASTAIAQSALETGFWTSRLWKEGRGGFGMQTPRSPENRKFQTGPSVDLGGVPHAGYANASDSFKHRTHWLMQDAKARPGLTIWQRFDTKWAPPDPKYPTNEGYSAKIQKIVKDWDLEQFDTVHPAPREDLKPSEPYVAVDPRDNYQRLPGTNSDRPRTGMPVWLAILLALAGAFFAGMASGSSWLGIVMDILKRLAG